MSDFEGDGLQEVRRQGAKDLSVTRRAAISRRQFLAGAFRGRGAALSGTGGASVLFRDLAQGKAGEYDRFGWNEQAHTRLDLSVPETAPKIQDWDNGIDGVLEEMANLKGIEDF